MVERDERARTSPHWFASQLDSSEKKKFIFQQILLSEVSFFFKKKGKV